MYEFTIQALEKDNEMLRQKIPTIEESIKTYNQMAKNFAEELEIRKEQIAQNEAVINQLKLIDDNPDLAPIKKTNND